MEEDVSHSAPGRLSLYVSYALLAAVMCVVLFIRLRFLTVPLERDEGEYAYAGQLILDGVDPYRFCYTMKLPGTAAAYALIMALFGQSATAIHFGLLLVSLATAALLFFLGRRLFGGMAGAAAGASYALLSLSPAMLGFAAHATQFVVLPAAAGLLLLHIALEKSRAGLFFMSGLLQGLAFIMKQPGLCFVFFAFAYLMFRLRAEGRRTRMARCALFAAGAALPFTAVCFLITADGGFGHFWLLVNDYARAYTTKVPLHIALSLLNYSSPSIFLSVWPLLLVALPGMVVARLDLRKNKTPAMRDRSFFLLGLFLLSCMAVVSGFYFRTHYFILLAPSVSLLCAAGTESLARMLAKYNARLARPASLALFGAAAGMFIYLNGYYYFVPDPQDAFIYAYRGNAFVEAREIGLYLKNKTIPQDRIAVFGSEPEVYFYAQRRSATGYIYMYWLVDKQPYAQMMQKEMRTEIETSRPKYILFFTTKLSWLVKPDGDSSIVTWAEHYAHDHYRMVGVSDNVDGQIEYHWQDAEHYRPKSFYTVYVFERKD